MRVRGGSGFWSASSIAANPMADLHGPAPATVGRFVTIQNGSSVPPKCQARIPGMNQPEQRQQQQNR